jgi:hypothetical protein
VSLAKDGKSLTGITGDLFQQLQHDPEPPSGADLDIQYQLLGAIKTALADARTRGMSREHVVDRMNLLLPELEKPITIRQLNAWTAVSKEFSEFPARYLPAFCAATNCDLPQRVMAQAIQRDLIDAREKAAQMLGENLIEDARLARQRRELKGLLER